MSDAIALDQLSALLRGEPTAVNDWSAVIGLANRAYITPRLAGRLPGDAPDDARVFVREVARRNDERSRRQLQQMGEAAAALNAVGITPLAIKGGAILARTGGACPRMTNDIDLVVPPAEVERALAALVTAGFPIRARHPDPAAHTVAELGRPEDVGLIDLHQRPPGPPGFFSQADLAAGPVRQAGPGRVVTPEPHLHVFLQTLHDQLHNGAYWRGGFDLRHAWDIADLIADNQPIDWDRLRRLPPTRLTARALEAQLAACHSLTGAPVPAWAVGWRTRLRIGRQRLQQTTPSLAAPLAALAVLAQPVAVAAHRAYDRSSRAALGLPPKPRGLTRAVDRMRWIFTAETSGRF